MTTTPTNPLDSALSLVQEFGFSMIACDVADKGPYGTNARKKAIADTTEALRQKTGNPKARITAVQLKELKRRYPIKGVFSKVNTVEGLQALARTVASDANYGICSDARYCVFETDNREKLEADLGFKLPTNTFIVSARPNRGYWMFEQTDRTREFLAAQKAKADTKGEVIFEVEGLFEWRQGGYCVSPNSIHPVTKKPYACKSRRRPIPFPNELLDGIIRLHTSNPSIKKSGGAGNTGDVVDSEYEMALAAIHAWRKTKEHKPEDALELPADFVITSTHPCFKKLVSHFYHPDEVDDLANVLYELEGYCHGDLDTSDVEDMIDWHVRHGSEPTACDECITTPSFIWSDQKMSPRTGWLLERDGEGLTGNGRGPVFCFDDEKEYAIFKLRVDQTPAWANAAEWPDREDISTYRWPDYAAWAKTPAAKKSEFKYPRVPGKKLEFVLHPKDTYDGWFPRSALSLVGGASGSAKTTMMSVLIEKQWAGESVFGHLGARLAPLILFADRGALSNEATLQRLGMENTKIPIDHMPVCWGLEAVNVIQERVERQEVLPEVVFVEGADVLVEDASKPQVVAPFLGALQRIAEHYHLSMVLSVGAPKAKPKEKHTLQRDRIFGSQIWPRMADTVITMEPVGDGTGGGRTLNAQHRNAPSEKFDLEFVGGRLMEVEPEAVEEYDSLTAWIGGLEGKRFTPTEAVEAMKTGGADLKKSAVYNRIKTLIDRKKLRAQWNTKRKVKELWAPNPQQDFKRVEEAEIQGATC